MLSVNSRFLFLLLSSLSHFDRMNFPNFLLNSTHSPVGLASRKYLFKIQFNPSHPNCPANMMTTSISRVAHMRVT